MCFEECIRSSYIEKERRDFLKNSLLWYLMRHHENLVSGQISNLGVLSCNKLYFLKLQNSFWFIWFELCDFYVSLIHALRLQLYVPTKMNYVSISMFVYNSIIQCGERFELVFAKIVNMYIAHFLTSYHATTWHFDDMFVSYKWKCYSIFLSMSLAFNYLTSC